MGAELLHYRPWRGEFQSPAAAVWPIARVSLRMIFRRKLFWVVYALGLLVFLLFFFGQYLLAWAETQVAEMDLPLMFRQLNRENIMRALRNGMKLNGSGETYRNLFWYQGYIVMVVLALAGSVLVGNDFQFRSLAFYLGKPVSRWHYLLGKGLAVAVFINMMTTLPAVVLFVQYGLLETGTNYFVDSAGLLLGILGYGLLLTVTLTLLLLATATLLRQTVPLVMAWTTLFLFLRMFAAALVDRLQYHPRWRLVDLWNDMYLLGNYFLGVPLSTVRPSPQPDVAEAALVLGAVALLCLSYLSLRIRAVEIVK